MGKRKRQPKKVKSVKSKDQRGREINKAKLQLSMLGMDKDTPGLAQAFDIFDNYVEHGGHCAGKIPLEGYQRVLKYILTMHPMTECTILLEYHPDV